MESFHFIRQLFGSQFFHFLQVDQVYCYSCWKIKRIFFFFLFILYDIQHIVFQADIDERLTVDNSTLFLGKF